MKIGDLMTKKVVTIDKDTSVQVAARTMNDKNIGCLVTTDQDGVAGILTERDMLSRVVEMGRNPKTTKVSEVMTRNIVFGNPNMELVEATRLMFQNRIKKLPIIEENGLVGLLTLTDVARATSVDGKTINLIEALSNMHMINKPQE
jgi:signal-transduction protein with cAMP-binding, CBS, and nucleotidyltransferase domain